MVPHLSKTIRRSIKNGFLTLIQEHYWKVKEVYDLELVHSLVTIQINQYYYK